MVEALSEGIELVILLTTVTEATSLEDRRCYQPIEMKEILMDTPKGIEEKDTELNAPEVFTMGRVSQETKGILHVMESPVGDPGGRLP